MTLIEPIRDVVVELWAVTIVCFLITIALLILIFCKRNFAKKYPMNVIALFAFTLCETWIVAFVCAFYEPIVVLIAAILALGVTIGLTIYAYKTKKDFTTMGGMIWSLIISLILFSFFMIFFYSSFTHLLFCLFAIFVYSFFIIYDTQLIAGGRYAELTYDDYILGSVMLYIDIIGLFLYILSLLGNKG